MEMTNARVNDKKVVDDLQDRFEKAKTKEEKEHILALCKLLQVEITIK